MSVKKFQFLFFSHSEKLPECHDKFLAPKEKPIKKKQFAGLDVNCCILLLTVVILLSLLFVLKIMERVTKKNFVFSAVDFKKEQAGFENCRQSMSSLHLGDTNNRITFFTPPREQQFNISRPGLYYLALAVQLKCTSAKQQISVMFHNSTLNKPFDILCAHLCWNYKSNIFIQKTLRAKAGNMVLLKSSASLKEYSGNFIKLEWYKN